MCTSAWNQNRFSTKLVFKFSAKMEKLPDVYPESDDTYLLVDSLRDDLAIALEGKARSGLVTIEVGPGGGLVSRTFLELCKTLNLHVFHLAVDVNMHAATDTLSECHNSGVIDCVNGDMLSFFRPGCQVDVIFCNPPYVPSSPINRARDIRASYAGGDRGRDFIDAFLPVVAERLKPGGVFYFLLEKRNDIDEVLRIANDEYGFNAVKVLDRKISGEHLFVYRLTRVVP